jgi:hypothetical protein
LKDVGKISTRTVVAGDAATVHVQSATSLPFVPLAEVQVGAKCTA